MALPKIYTVNDLLQVLPLSRNTIYLLLETGQLVGKKVGAKWLITEPHLLEWLNTEQETNTQ